jgi:hypothetical protein
MARKKGAMVNKVIAAVDKSAYDVGKREAK